MKDRQADLNRETEALQKDWTHLEPFRLPVEKVKGRSSVFICELPDAGSSKQAYIKVYANKKHPFQRFLRRGKSRTEARNLLFFKSIGIPTPNVLAWGERRMCQQVDAYRKGRFDKKDKLQNKYAKK